MKIKTLELMGANCYLISSPNAAIVIDPGAYSPVLSQFFKENADKSRLIILTHGHFDHIAGANKLREETGVDIAIGQLDADYLTTPQLNLCGLFGMNIEPFTADRLLKDGEKLTVGDIDFTVLHTPGHTMGSVCLLNEDTLFSGDVLFRSSIGRSDFPGSDTEQLKASLKRLMELDGKTAVLSGHGEPTTIEFERLYNPYIKGAL